MFNIYHNKFYIRTILYYINRFLLLTIMTDKLCSPVNKSNIYLASALHDGIEDHNLKHLSFLLSVKRADPNTVMPGIGLAPIHLIIINKDQYFAKEALNLMLIHGGNPNAHSEPTYTPLHLAAMFGKEELMKLLLSYGGDPLSLDKNGWNPFHYAFYRNYYNIVTILIDHFRNLQVDDETQKYKINLDKVVLVDGNVRAEYTPDVYKCDLISSNKKSERQITDHWVDLQKRKLGNRYNKFYNQSCVSSELTDNKHVNTLENSMTNEKLLENTSRENEISEKLVESGFQVNNLNKDKKIDFDEISSDYNISVMQLGEQTKDNTTTNDSMITNVTENDDSNISKENISQRMYTIDEEYKYSDNEEKVFLLERRLCTSVAGNTSSNNSFDLYKPDTWHPPKSPQKNSSDPPPMLLRQRLMEHGEEPGPITTTTYGVYLRRLMKLTEKKLENKGKIGYPKTDPEVDKVSAMLYKLDIKAKIYKKGQMELLNLDCNENLLNYQQLELEMCCEFVRPEPTRKWREGMSKNSFNYILLDPRIAQDLPRRASNLTEQEKWQIFLSAIFYIGKGKRARPYAHLYDAFHIWSSKQKTKEISEKCECIVDIWNEGQGVIVLHVFQNIIPVEAYTREAIIIETIGLKNLANNKSGEFYGPAYSWPVEKRQKLGKYLLYKAMEIFMLEGERQLFPENI